MEYKNRLKSVVCAFWNGDGCSVDDTEGRKKAIMRATKDLMARTLSRSAPEEEKFNDAICKALLPKIDEWFRMPQDSIDQDVFDEWHGRVCAKILEILRYFYKNRDGSPVAYGKAQKIVNMTMKGIYCLEGAMAEEREAYFRYCHIALDSFTLEWFKRAVVEPDKNLVKGKVDSWSTLQDPETEEYKSGKNCFYTYHKIVALIRRHFALHRPFEGLTPLQAEFFIWSEIQLAMAAEALYGQNIGKEEAVASAQQRWNIQWTDAQKTDINKQFDRCKKEFKLRPLKEKVEFLRTRVDQLCKYMNVCENT